MTMRFYDNPKDGMLHFSATAGGGVESGQTSQFDVVATEEHKIQHRREYDDYLLARDKKKTDPASQETLINHLETSLKDAQGNVERLATDLSRAHEDLADARADFAAAMVEIERLKAQSSEKPAANPAA